MVAHQTKAMDTVPIVRDALLQEKIKTIAVIVVKKDILSAVATQHDVVYAAVFVKSGFTRHGVLNSWMEDVVFDV